ncbi:hypothetical protein EG834_14115 [bacterium]|nr:hypothetical protein [bacterium]
MENGRGEESVEKKAAGSGRFSRVPEKRSRSCLTIGLIIVGLFLYCAGTTAVISISGYRMYQREVLCPPAPADWELYFLDDFDSDANTGGHWLEKADEYPEGHTQWDIRDGQYFALIEAPGGFFTEATNSNLWLTDFHLSVDLEKVTGTEQGYSGVTYRSTLQGSYYFVISDDGYYAVWLYTGEWIVLIPWTETRLIHPETSNRLTVLMQGPEMVLCINNQRVEALDSEARPSGLVGLVAGVFEQEQGEAQFVGWGDAPSALTMAFDNFTVYIP